MPFAAALSEHPMAAEAIGEVLGEVLGQVGPAPDLALLVVAEALAPRLADLVAVVHAVLAPEVLLGVTARRVVSGAREVDSASAISLWAGHVGPVQAVRIPPDGAVATPSRLIGREGGRGTLLLLADPSTLPVDALLARLARDDAELDVVGGLVGSPLPGRARLVLDAEVHTDGAVGVLLGSEPASVPLVAQGCRPVGEPMIVTEADGPVVLGLAGRPALDRLGEATLALPADDRFLFETDPHLGIVLDEHRETFSTGDFLVRRVVGTDAVRRGLVLGEAIAVGTTVQLQVRDASSAGDELREALADGWAEPAPPGAALLFSSGARASIEIDDRDAVLVSDLVGPAVAGLGCIGEIAPAAGRSRLHVASAAVLLLGDPPDPPA